MQLLKTKYTSLLALPLLLVLCVFALPSQKVFAASTYTVNSIGDDSDANPGDSICETATPDECTLRAAIEEVNAGSGGDTINFGISGTGVHTLTPASCYDTITKSVTIDGYSQPGSAANTAVAPAPLNGTLTIEIDGTSAGGGCDGLSLNANNITVRGLVINRFSSNGIRLGGGGTGIIIAGNYLGTDPTGQIDLGNTQAGLRSQGGQTGITIGGTAAADRNLVSGNNGDGLHIREGNGMTIQGNYIGVAADGTTDLGNNLDGVVLRSNNDVVGGTTVGAMNVISGNGLAGITVTDASSGATILGNYIGPDSTGLAIVGNGGVGIILSVTSGNTIGGTTTSARNIISGSGVIMQIRINNSSGNTIQGNYIGTDKNGNSVTNPANINGVGVYNSSSNNLIGGTGAGEGNKIAYNTASGVLVDNITSLGGTNPLNNTIIGNDIEQNTDSGIRLCNDTDSDFVCDTPEPYPNDSGDPDEGPNMFMNFPVINSATKGTGQVTVNYDLDINPAEVGATGYSVDFYANSTNAREGAIYLGSDVVPGSVTGQSATLTLPGSVPADYYVTAVTTMTDVSSDGYGHSSEFSAPVQATVSSTTTNNGSTSSSSLAETGQNTNPLILLSSILLTSGLALATYTYNKQRRKNV